MRMRVDLSEVSVLVVDDNAHMRSILRSILAGFGARRIFEASDGADGLEIVIDRAPDLVLLDWAMAPVSGEEFLKLLRGERDPLLATTPVIAVSGHARRSVILDAMRLGVHGFVAKPVAPAVLYQRIEDALLRQERNGRSKGLRRERSTFAGSDAAFGAGHIAPDSQISAGGVALL
ncbi:response regulator [Pannonibacter phragmitetus]|uniref:response regulator n=1 Tax=Pannonibacter phragmitetus TaxID=121719 RepID=UPI003D2F5126